MLHTYFILLDFKSYSNQSLYTVFPSILHIKSVYNPVCIDFPRAYVEYLNSTITTSFLSGSFKRTSSVPQSYLMGYLLFSLYIPSPNQDFLFEKQMMDILLAAHWIVELNEFFRLLWENICTIVSCYHLLTLSNSFSSHINWDLIIYDFI